MHLNCTQIFINFVALSVSPFRLHRLNELRRCGDGGGKMKIDVYTHTHWHRIADISANTIEQAFWRKTFLVSIDPKLMMILCTFLHCTRSRSRGFTRFLSKPKNFVEWSRTQCTANNPTLAPCHSFPFNTPLCTHSLDSHIFPFQYS